MILKLKAYWTAIFGDSRNNGMAHTQIRSYFTNLSCHKRRTKVLTAFGFLEVGDFNGSWVVPTAHPSPARILEKVNNIFVRTAK